MTDPISSSVRVFFDTGWKAEFLRRLEHSVKAIQLETEMAASDIATVGAFVTGYPLTLLDAFQRAHSYQVTNATLLGEKPKHQQIAFATSASDHHEIPAKPTRIADAVWAKMT